MKEKVSLYIPCYNVEKFISRSIEAALNQTYPIDEVLIIDDGSRDSTVQIASGYPVKVIRHEKNKGLGAARNTGFSNAENELVAAIDADCVPEPDWLEKLMGHMGDDRIAASGGRLVESAIYSVADRWRKAHMTQDWGEELIKNPPIMFGNNIVMRRSAVMEAGGFDETMRTNGEDVDISKKLRNKGYNYIYDPAAVVNHARTDTMRSILDTYWRYWRFGSRAYFERRDLKVFLYHSYYHHFGRHFLECFAKDWREKKLALTGIDLALPFYMTYRDMLLLLAMRTRR